MLPIYKYNKPKLQQLAGTTTFARPIGGNNPTASQNPATQIAQAAKPDKPSPPGADITVDKTNISGSSAANSAWDAAAGGVLRFPLTELDKKTLKTAPFITFTVFKQDPTFTGGTDQQYYKDVISGANTVLSSDTLRTLAVGAAAVKGFGAGASAGATTGNALVTAQSGLVGSLMGAIGLDAAITGADYVWNNTDVGRTLKNSLNNFSTDRNNTRITRSIQLAMPEGIQVQYDHEYDVISATQATGMLGFAAAGLKELNKGQFSTTDPYVLELASKGFEKLGGEGAGKLSFYGMSGMVVNPKLETIYTSPKLRTFVFDFRLIPKNAAESNAIAQIIRAFKWHAAPDIPDSVSNGRYFIPPDQFQISFNSGSAEYDGATGHMFKTKYCVLTNISIDYSAGGNGFTTFKDGAPTETRLQMTFQETRILSKADIAGGY